MKIVDGHTRFAASDLSNFLACRHLIRLDKLSAQGRLKPDKPFDIGFEMLVERGEAHEATVLARFRADGLDVVEVPRTADAEAAAATRDALRSGAHVICRWSANCNARRRADNDLSLVAGMPTNQRLALKAVDVRTRRGFAGLDELPKLSRGNPGSLERAQMQARLQVASEDAGRIQCAFTRELDATQPGR
jgi:hypothetical protein